MSLPVICKLLAGLTARTKENRGATTSQIRRYRGKIADEISKIAAYSRQKIEIRG